MKNEPQKMVRTSPTKKNFTIQPCNIRQRVTHKELGIEETFNNESDKKRFSSNLPSMVLNVMSSKGHPLDSTTRTFMESRLGHDFSQVRIHTNPKAAETAKILKARAYTIDNDIVFSKDQYSPNHPTGKYLLAHELTHVLQARMLGKSKYSNANRKNYHAQLENYHRKPVNSDAEHQAHHVAKMILSDQHFIEPIIPSSGLQLTPDNGPTGESTSSRPVTPPRRRTDEPSMPELMVEWHNAGLLRPPFRPPSVPEIPPIPISEERSRTLGLTPTAAGLALPAPSPTPSPTPTGPGRPPLRVIPGGGGAAAPRPMAPGAGAGALRLLGPVAIGLTIFLTPRTTAPPWMDTLNPITRRPYGGPEEYRWVRRLTRLQRDYLRWLNRARRFRPDTTLESDPAPTDLPRPLPQPQPREREEPRNCFSTNISRRGGHRRHDAYATKVTGSSHDYFVSTPTGYAIAYDGLSSPVFVWEVKIGYGWLFTSNPRYRSLVPRKLAEFDAQKNRGLAVANECGYVHYWSIPDRWVAGLLNARWGFNPVVFSISE